jgi:anti-sigma factor RsiW
MNCQTAQTELGPLLDGELPPERAAALRQHVQECGACAEELTSLRELEAAVRSADPATRNASPPSDLWTQIQGRLPSEPAAVPKTIRLFRRPLALAASLALLLGAGAFVAVWLNSTAQVAQAGSIDYQMLLDGLATDADASVNRFLQHYKARRMDVEAVQAEAAPFTFRLPASLPGDYKLQECYRLQFGTNRGYAARYRRADGEPVFVFFHSPVSKTLMGVHRESHCDLAQGSHCVEVGPWQLIHYTDPTTCHCLLSRVRDESQLRAILAAISSGLASTAPSH